MAVVIHRDPQLHKCLTKLRRAGGRALLAAEQVETILTRLAAHAGRHPDAVHKRTRHGEARIENCKKFDLVGGYRLVYIHEAQQYYFLFAGTHDDCDRWLTHHRDFTLEMPGGPTDSRDHTDGGGDACCRACRLARRFGLRQCYRCLYPKPPPPGLVPSCAEGGVLGILPGIVGVIQAAEAVKLILHEGESLVGRLLLFDALKMQFRELRLRRSRQCPAQGQCTLVQSLIDYDQFCGVAPAPAADVVAAWEITPGQLKDKLDRGEEMTIIDVREPHEWQIANLARYGARLIPLGQFPQRLNDINPADDIVVHCKVGGRSAQAYEVLQQAGYTRIKNLKGGILAWADQVDRSMQKY